MHERFSSPPPTPPPAAARSSSAIDGGPTSSPVGAASGRRTVLALAGGGRLVIVGRFIGILRALTPFVAGASAYPLRRFLPYTAIGAFGWATAFTLVGYGFSESFQSAGRDATRIALIGALVIGTILLARAIQTRTKSNGGD